jgi:hypothetical protein
MRDSFPHVLLSADGLRCCKVRRGKSDDERQAPERHMSSFYFTGPITSALCRAVEGA